MTKGQSVQRAGAAAGKLMKGLVDPSKPKRIRIRKRDVSAPPRAACVPARPPMVLTAAPEWPAIPALQDPRAPKWPAILAPRSAGMASHSGAPYAGQPFRRSRACFIQRCCIFLKIRRGNAETIRQVRARTAEDLLPRVWRQGHLPPQSHPPRVPGLQGKGAVRAQSPQDHVSSAPRV